MLVGSVVLFATTLAGIFFACRVFNYEITTARKIGAALVFMILNALPLPIPIPLIAAALPSVGLYISLVDSTYKHDKVTKVFLVTVLFAIIAILAIYLPTTLA